jgi:hypothetical protein
MPCCLPLSALQQRCLRVGVSCAPTRRRNYALILGASVLADRAADVRDAPALVAQRLGALLVCAVASLGLQASPEHALWASAYEFSWWEVCSDSIGAGIGSKRLCSVAWHRGSMGAGGFARVL